MKIAIITGGETGERTVSINSAQNIASLIDFAEVEMFIFPETSQDFFERATTFNLVIPIIHGIGGEDGKLQKELQEINLPFIFSDPNTHSIAIDKKKTKEVTTSLGILSPKEKMTPPYFAKPRFGGSSVASKLCKSEGEFNMLASSFPDIEFIKEELISGKEFTVGIIEKQGKPIQLPVIEIISKDGFFDYESKYNPDKLASEVCPAHINLDLTRELQKQARDVHKHLGVRHISRSDFFITPEDKIYFLEINTIPGMTNTSLIPKMLMEAQIPLKDLLKEWCYEVSIEKET